MDNHVPIIDDSSIVSGSVHELDGTAPAGNVADGAILFTDADVSDVHSLPITGVTASGVTSGLPDAQALLGLLTPGALAEPAGGQPGSVSWRFTASDPVFDYLGAGEVVTLTYKALIADG